MPVQPLSDRQLATLRLLCDTVVPAVERGYDPDGFWSRKATDVGADLALAEVLSALPPAELEGMRMLLDELEGQGFSRASARSREQILRNLSLMSSEARVGVQALVNGALFMTYGLPDPATGQNPMWSTFGYPGPISAPSPQERALEPLVPEGDELSLEADAVVVGSGAGGGVIAGVLADAGLRVVVLEAGGYFDRGDFNMLELWAFQNLYYRGGPTPTADRNVSMQAGLQRRRRDDGQLDQLPAHPALGARAVGTGVRPRGGGRAGVRPPHRRGDGADRRERELQRLQRPHTADEGGSRAARLVVRARDPQRRP